MSLFASVEEYYSLPVKYMKQNLNKSNANDLNILDDEITFVQIVRTLIERKKWFFGIFLFFFLIFIFLAYKKYPVDETKVSPWKFTTYLFVGSYPGQSTPVESFSSIKFSIEEIYSKSMSLPLTIENDLIKMGNIVVISTIAESEEEEIVRKIHEAAIRPVLERHRKLFLPIEKKTFASEQNLKSPENNGLPTSILALAQKTKHSPVPDKVWIRILQIGFLISILSSCVGVFVIEYGLQIKKNIKS